MKNEKGERISNAHMKWCINKRRREGESTKQAAKRLALGEGVYGPFYEDIAKEWLDSKGVGRGRE